ncbi:MAG: sulfurtransferase TusA family protein [Candidatus Methylomirabilales bacterium]
MTEKAETAAATVLDTRGEICPYPLIMTQRAMTARAPGERLRVLVDYPMSVEDIPRWAEGAGHVVLRVEKTGNALWEIEIEKG